MVDDEFKQDATAKRLIGESRIILPPKRRGASWNWSRLVVTAEGPIPILSLLAREVFPEWDSRTHVPFWKDRNPRNEAAENVGLVEQGSRRRPRRSSLGLPSGTKEYWRAYRTKNKLQVRKYHKDRNAKLRADAEKWRTAVDAGAIAPEVEKRSALEDIFKAAGRPLPEEEK
jgi:hypothetical protein